MRYLSPEWFRAAASAVARVRATNDERTVIGQRVTGGPDGQIDYRLVIAEGECRLATGVEPAAEVHLTLSYELARGIAAGRRAAKDAFLHGDIRVDGDPTVLVRHAALAADLAAALRSVPTDLHEA